ncbi:MAG: protein kinase [Deltaproteobacteria bacterium]|nr:protein kinase [Deltaproteobacteria bacterium]
MSSAEAPLPTMPQPGTLLDGKYRLVRQLGAGGMGLVFEADHVRLRQPFAIKVLQPQLAQHREFCARFEREARAAALLRSPHVVRVFDVDVSSEGLTYLVMELLEGRDLAAEATEGPVPVANLADWLVQACAALQEAHDQGIVHRDLKPANIFLAKMENGERIAKVVDFGISKVEATSTNILSVRDGTALGTPTFMSPEQIRGRRVDGRADLWALGVIMYRILGGRWPFNGKTEQEYMGAVLSDPAIPFEMVRPELPFELATVIMKALEKDVGSRFASASEMAAALAPFGSGRGPLVSMTSLPPPAMRAAQPRPLADDATARRAVVVPHGSQETRSDRAALMDTVVQPTPNSAPAKTVPLGVAQPSPPAVFVPGTPAPSVRQPGPPPSALTPPVSQAAPPAASRSGLVAALAVVAAASLGFGAYMFLTKKVPASGTVPSVASELPSATSAPSSTGGAPMPSIDPAIAAAQPAPTGITETAPSASASASAKRRNRVPPKPGVPEPPEPQPTAPAVPDHL